MNWKLAIVGVILVSALIGILVATQGGISPTVQEEELEFEYMGVRLVQILQTEGRNDTYSPWLLFANRQDELTAVRIKLSEADKLWGEGIFYLEPYNKYEDSNDGISFQEIAGTRSDFRITLDELNNFTVEINGKEVELAPVEILGL